jgi:hypothetical protein
MSNSSSHRFPVTVTQLPVMRCQICHRTVGCRPGNGSEVLIEHYRRANAKPKSPYPAMISSCFVRFHHLGALSR